MNTGNALLLTKGLSFASINCWHVRVNIRQQKQNPSVARCTRTFSRASGATGGTFIQSGGWDSSITPKTRAAPCEVPSFRLPSAGTYLISSPVSFAVGLSSLNRRTVAGFGIFFFFQAEDGIRD